MLLSFIAAFAIGWILRKTIFLKKNGMNAGVAFIISATLWPLLVVVQAVLLETERNIVMAGNNAVSQSVAMSSLAFAIGFFLGIRRKTQSDLGT